MEVAAELHLNEAPDADSGGLNVLNGTELEAKEALVTLPEQEVESAVKVYFVKIPRPPTDETAREHLQKAFQANLSDLKAINARVAAKRDVVKGLRGQMHEAMSLKGSAQPEFEDKLNKLKQLRNLRQSYLADITSIKNKVKGLDCKTEQDLDAKISQEEDRIGTVPLREEKMIVSDISKLRSQREKIKEYELERSRLGELESSVTKVKAAIEDMEAEFSVIKGEFDAASKVTSGFYDQLKAAEKEVSKVEEDQKEAVERKNEAHEALEAAKREVDASMYEYRENRKFSLQIRDLVANAEVEAAQELCAAQMDQMITRWLSDATFRAEYNKLLAEHRRFPVSDLLPASSTATVVAAAPSARSSAKAAAPAVKLVPRGKEIAQELIASIMSSASVEAAHRRSAAPREPADEPEEVDDVVEVSKAVAPKPTVPSKPAAAPKHVANPAAKAAEVFNFKVEVPKVEDVEFVMPVVKTETETMSKEQIREEQRAKAQEAELRKKKRQETAGKKKAKAIELQKKADDDERSTKRAVVESKALEPSAAAATDEEEEEEPVTIVERAAAPAQPAKHAAPNAVVPQRLVAPAAKRPAGKSNLLRRLKKFYQANQASIVVVAVIALILFILIAASFY